MTADRAARLIFSLAMGCVVQATAPLPSAAFSNTRICRITPHCNPVYPEFSFGRQFDLWKHRVCGTF